MDALNASQHLDLAEPQFPNLEKKVINEDCTSEYISTCGSSEISQMPGAECDGKLQLCSQSQPPPHSLHDSDLCARESGSLTPVPTIDQQPTLQNGEESSSENSSLKLSSTVLTISNPIDTSQASTNDECKKSSDSGSLNDLTNVENTVVESVVSESSSPFNDIRNCTSPGIEEMDSQIDYNQEAQKPDTGSSSNKQTSESRDSTLQPSSECGDSTLQPSSECGDSTLQPSSECEDLTLQPSSECEDLTLQPSSECGGSTLQPSSECGDSTLQTSSECGGSTLQPSSECGDSTLQPSSECGDSTLQPSSECHEAANEHSDMIIDCSNVKTEGNIDDGDDLNINLKQEPHDSEYERPELNYRSGTIVEVSDDDTSSTTPNNNDVCSGNDFETSDEEVVERLNARKITMAKSSSRTNGEVFPEELPPLEYLTISPDENVVLEPVGAVSGIVGVLVIVKAKLNSPALFDDTVLFLDGRKPLGLVFEIFGTVEQPFYSVRFNSSKDIKDREITVGDKVFFAPKADNLTKYVFIAELRKIKCDDASWEHDNEPPPSQIEFSDDEEERKARQRHQNKDRVTELLQRLSGRRKKRRKKHKHNSEHGKDPQGPQLLQGDLNRNPFGKKSHTISSPKVPHKPKSEQYGQMGNGQGFPSHMPNFSPQSAPPPFFRAFRQPWPPYSGFGERPGWNHRPGFFPNASMTGSPNGGCSWNGNMFSPHQMPPWNSRMPFPSPSQPSPYNMPGYNSGPPHSSMFSQMNNFGYGPHFSRSNVEHISTSGPPSPQVPGNKAHQPYNFPMFGPTHPPSFVNSVFPPPSHQPPHK